MIASFYYIPTQNLEWTNFIYINLVYLQKEHQVKARTYIPREQKKNKIKLKSY